MRVRFAFADALLRVETGRAVELALEHFNHILQFYRGDSLGVRNIIPGLLLRLGREQECYDFLKWWAIISVKDTYDWEDATLPFLDIRNADVFESVDIFSSESLSLSQLVILTLLKLRLYLDLMSFEETEFGFEDDYPEFGRPVGRLVNEKMRAFEIRDISATIKSLEAQYRKLSRIVNDMNPHFWGALGDEETPSPPSSYSVGSIEEAELVSYQCKPAWRDTEDAMLMIDSVTANLTKVYHGSTATDHTSDPRFIEEKRASRKIFPSRFKPRGTTSIPTEIFPATRVGQTQMIRFIYRDDKGKVLAYTDGACANNGKTQPRAGWAVVYGPSEHHDIKCPCVVSGQLESQGPFGGESVVTSNRAELRAAIEALRLDWQCGRFDTIVIATDSSYVVNGATGWVKGWTRNGWKTRNGGMAKNRDLWEVLLDEVEKLDDQGLRVQLWNIPRELNRDADAAAKKAITMERVDIKGSDTVTSLPSSTIAVAEPRPRILTLCLENEALFDDIFRNLVSQIASRARMERATTQEAALSILDQVPVPSVILIADSALTRRSKVWERVIDRLREGATVVVAGSFSSMVSTGQFNRFFARLGLSWEMGSYQRETVSLCTGVVSSNLIEHLPSAYSLKAVFVKKVERSAIWYASSSNSDEAAVVFTQVGKGRLGYIGDVNSQEDSDRIVLAMCGILT
jgi:ribonuclease HI